MQARDPLEAFDSVPTAETVKKSQVTQAQRGEIKFQSLVKSQTSDRMSENVHAEDLRASHWAKPQRDY